MTNTVWWNADGLPVKFGRRQGERLSRAGNTRSNQKEQELVMVFELTEIGRAHV